MSPGGERAVRILEWVAGVLLFFLYLISRGGPRVAMVPDILSDVTS
jgi:hypothetical protein